VEWQLQGFVGVFRIERPVRNLKTSPWPGKRIFLRPYCDRQWVGVSCTPDPRRVGVGDREAETG